MESTQIKMECTSDKCDDKFSDVASDCENNDGICDSDVNEGSDDDFPVFSKRSLRAEETEDSEEDNDDISVVQQEWSTEDIEPNYEEFCGQPGLRVKPGNPQNIGDVTSLFIDEEIFRLIAEETNKFHKLNEHKYKTLSHCAKWVDISIEEIKKFFALTIIMGEVRKDKISDYWSTDPLIETNIFPRTLSRNRFMEILAYMHFESNENLAPEIGQLYKVHNILEYFLLRFEHVYKPKQNLLLQESVIPFRGKFSFYTCDASNISRYGILVRLMSEADSGYICNLKLYAEEKAEPQKIVLSLLGSNTNNWHNLYLKSFYNSVSLADKLLKFKTRMCGTIKPNRGFPRPLRMQKLEPCQWDFRRRGDILSLVWKSVSKKDIMIISTIHNSDTIKQIKKGKVTGHFIQKPKCISDYEKYMKGMDRIDQNLAFQPIFRKTSQWAKKVVFYLFNCALFNACIVYNHLNPTKKMNFKKYLLNVAKLWLGQFPIEPMLVDNTSTVTPTPRAHRIDPPERLSGNMNNHVLRKIVNMKNNKSMSRRCRVCYAHKKRSSTRFMCQYCQVPLHVGYCFDSYHTKVQY